MRRLTALWSALFFLACADDGRMMGSEPGILEFDPDMIGGDAGGDGGFDGGPDSSTSDSGVEIDECSARPVVVGSRGELTAYPNIRLEVLSPEFSVRSLNYVVKTDSDVRGPLMVAYIEVENTGGGNECDFLPDVRLDGFLELVALIETPPHYTVEWESTVTNDCLLPGETGVIRALERGISVEDLESARSLSLDMGQGNLRTGRRASATSLANVEIGVVEAGGFGLSGTVTPSQPIRNYAIRVYPRDSRGLIIGQLLAFPNELESLPRFVDAPFETDGVGCSFSDYLIYESWILED